MANCETTPELLDLKTRLASIQDMLGWLCTDHRFRVNYPKSNEATKRIQSQVDIASEFINTIYVYSILDEAGFKLSNKWMDTDDKLEFKAWVHIRHTGANTPEGRANVYYQKFDNFMNSTNAGMSGLKQNCTWTADSIILPYARSFKFFLFATNLVDKAIVTIRASTHY
jgi:hypothetical protein